MPRPALAIGQHGTITTKRYGAGWRSSTYVRDADGKRREVRREGRTKGAAESALQDALSERPAFAGAGIERDTRVHVVADVWFAQVQAQVAAGELAPNSLRVYSSVWRNHVAPAFGDLRVREATAGRVDRFLVDLRARRSASTARTARAILSGLLGTAVRESALATNPVRDAGRITDRAKKPARALTPVERELWLNRVHDDYRALRHDIPDMTRFLLSTGVRIAECLAVTFADVDFMERSVKIDHQIVRVTGTGLVRTRTKSAASERTLLLPHYTVEMLTDRLRMLGEGPVFPAEDDGGSTSRGPRARGLWRDPSNTGRAFRAARDRAGFDWVTTHAFRKTVATVLDEGGLTAREIADQLGHSRISMTQDTYMARRVASDRAASALMSADVWETRRSDSTNVRPSCDVDQSP